jgi:sulfotransferase family protein
VEPLVRILEVERFALDGATLVGGDLTSPAPGTGVGPGYGIEFAGWVQAADSPVERVDLVQDAMALWELEPQPAEDGRAVFGTAVNALALPREFDVVVRVQLGDGDGGARARLAAVRGTRAQLRTDVQPRIDPLMVTTFSRTGSNLFLRMLAEHPRIAAYRPFEYEPRVSAYWIEVLRELTEPASYRRQITPQLRQPTRGWWLGPAGPTPPPLEDRALEEAIARDTVEDVARFCQSRIDATYARIAPLCGREGAAYFAEKHSPNEVPMLVSELYPNAREVFLVRDFRDMIASMLAADERRGDVRFGRAETDSDERFVRRFRRFSANLAASWRRRSGRAHLIRYEDLLRQPRETVAALVEYLGLETDDAALARMTDSLVRREEALEGHITSDSPEASIGRWRRDLDPALQGLTEEVFRDALELFGYERSGKAA